MKNEQGFVEWVTFEIFQSLLFLALVRHSEMM